MGNTQKAHLFLLLGFALFFILTAQPSPPVSPPPSPKSNECEDGLYYCPEHQTCCCGVDFYGMCLDMEVVLLKMVFAVRDQIYAAQLIFHCVIFRRHMPQGLWRQNWSCCKEENNGQVLSYHGVVAVLREQKTWTKLQWKRNQFSAMR